MPILPKCPECGDNDDVELLACGEPQPGDTCDAFCRFCKHVFVAALPAEAE